MPDLEGGCLCGAVRYRLSPSDAVVDFCHCDTCRRWSGAPVSAWAQVPPGQFTLTKGAVGTFASSPNAARHFCPVCGTSIYMTDPQGRSVGILLGTLDQPVALAPTQHGWTSRHLTWLALSDNLPCWPEDPPYDAD